jgi:DNA-binding response OmpR family regulator
MMHVLVVDDDQDHAESIADILLMQGHDVDVAHSGEEAIERFPGADFDLALLDIKLPGMNGVDTFFAFRKARPAAQVMLMTGFAPEQPISRAVEAGALGVLKKPFSVGNLLTALQQV